MKMRNNDLRIHIQIATSTLGRDPSAIKFPVGKTALKNMLYNLREEQREVGGILKPSQTDDEAERARA